MSASLIQLSAIGVQDIYLRIAPEFTLFKRTYKRHTNYSVEALEQDFSGSLDWGKSLPASLSRNGDLVCECWFVPDIQLLQLTNNANGVYWTNSLGNAAMETIEYTIGGNNIQTMYGEYLEIFHELMDLSDDQYDYSETQLRSPSQFILQQYANNGNTRRESDGDKIVRLYQPLQLHFSRWRSQALPIISLQYHDVKIRIKLRRKSDLIRYTNGKTSSDLDSTYNGQLLDAKILCNYVYLDSQERRLFAANSHEYLVHQVQKSDGHSKAAGVTTLDCNLTFNHPTACLFWVIQRTEVVNANDYFNYELTNALGDDTFQSVTLKLNSFDRFKPREPLYFRVVTPSLYFNRTPKKNIYAYSFASHPCEWWPSGSINFSRIDKVSLRLTLPANNNNSETSPEAEVKVYALSYNVLRVQAGMAAIKYAN